MRKKVVVLGSTGSLGVKVLELLKRHQKNFELIGLSANKSKNLLDEQAKNFKVKNVLLLNKKPSSPRLAISLLEDFASMPEADIIVNVLSGTAGIAPTIAALKAKKILLLANKEALVAEGKKIMQLASLPHQIKVHTTLIPLDSEHNAIYEILQKFPDKKIKRIFLPCSGGPFWNKTAAQLKTVTPQDALKHPKWKMGHKISVESATLINKGLEIIEAHYLFQVPLSKIKVILHPQCQIHGMVQFTDNTQYAYLAKPDMTEHLENALLRAANLKMPSRKIVKLTPEIESRYQLLTKFPSHLPGIQIVLNAYKKNPQKMLNFLQKEEKAIEDFLEHGIKFTQIFKKLQAPGFN